MNGQNEEKATLDRRLPKFYKGHDMDEILAKMISRKMTRDDEIILYEALVDYQKECEEEYERRTKEGRPLKYEDIVAKICEKKKNDKETMEMSSVDPLLPRFYKGYDMDILTEKLRNRKGMKEIEKAILSEAQQFFYYEEARYSDDLLLWMDMNRVMVHVHPGMITDENRNLPHNYVLFYETHDNIAQKG